MAVAAIRRRQSGWAWAIPPAVAVWAAVQSLLYGQPRYALALAGVCVLLFSPRLCRLALIAAVAVGPTFNPAVLGIAGGRVYVVQLAMLAVFTGAVAAAVRNGLHLEAVALVVLSGLLVAVETLGRPHAGLAWVYRPLQVFLVAFSVRALFHGRSTRPLALALAWGAVVGCTLASLNALVPRIDPFALSRPADIPYVSAIGSYARATGAFTYPNNLGTFAAYAVLFGAAAWLLGRPSLPANLAMALMVSGGAAVLLSGGRAAGLGLLVGLLYLTAKAAPRRRTAVLIVEATLGMVVVMAVLSSPTAREVAQQRVESATGESLSIRVDDWRASLRDFRRSPLVGTGATESRTDNFWVLYLAEGGVAGAAILLLLARVTFRDRRPRVYPELHTALLVALCVSGLLQDSLGQTLATWFLGALLGLCVTRPRAAAPAAPPVPALAAAGVLRPAF